MRCPICKLLWTWVNRFKSYSICRQLTSQYIWQQFSPATHGIFVFRFVRSCGNHSRSSSSNCCCCCSITSGARQSRCGACAVSTSSAADAVADLTTSCLGLYTCATMTTKTRLPAKSSYSLLMFAFAVMSAGQYGCNWSATENARMCNINEWRKF